MNIFYLLKEEITKISKSIGYGENIGQNFTVELPKDALHGDVSTNIAMVVASAVKSMPRMIAEKYKQVLDNLPYVAHTDIAGPGFINIIIKPFKWHECILDIIEERNYMYHDIGVGQTVNIEYVSANPTGPMHIGHARGAVYGDALAKLLSVCGYNVTKEYYVNDAGSQIETLFKTVMLRYKDVVNSTKSEIPDGWYPGEYLIPVGEKLALKYKDELLSLPHDECYEKIKRFIISEMLDLIKSDLKELGVQHDVFYSENTLHEEGKIDEVIKILTDIGMIYEGALPPPKGLVDESWEKRNQLLFKSSKFGDDQDRPVQKSDGSWTYLAADLAYAKNKIDRNFDHLIYVLGADHSGYIKRINAVVQALGGNNVQSHVKICQLVHFMHEGVPLKMSKRAGTFTTVKDVTDAVGKDIVRFIMLTRKNDAALDFDLEAVKEYSKDNPVFYVQYAHVRTVSILANGQDNAPDAYKKFLNKEFDLSLLDSQEELQLIKLLGSWEKIIEVSVAHFEPHRIAFYLMNIAAKFHSIWNLGKENNNYRFVIKDNIELTASRLALAKSVQLILVKGFEIIGITPINQM